MMDSPLAQALALTRAMLEAARAGDYPGVARLHEQRARLLQPDLHSQQDAPRLLPQLEAAQVELMKVIAAARGDASRALLDAQRGYAAASAYLDAARG